MPVPVKPMLATAAPKDLTKLTYPVYASPKLDGIRCITDELGMPFSRNGKEIRNQHIRSSLIMAGSYAACLDGELVTLDDDGNIKPFNEVSGDVMRKDGQPNFEYLVFDTVLPESLPKTFATRQEDLKQQLTGQFGQFNRVRIVPQVRCDTREQLEEFEEHCVRAGYEGVMVRNPRAEYKQGRSTVKEQGLLKIKRFKDDEATVVGYVCEYKNTNPKDPLTGKRGMAKAGLVPKDRLGALVVEHPVFGEFEVGAGFTADMRDAYWRSRQSLAGRVVKFRYQEAGALDKPRFPTFLGFRDPADMS